MQKKEQNDYFDKTKKCKTTWEKTKDKTHPVYICMWDMWLPFFVSFVFLFRFFFSVFPFAGNLVTRILKMKTT
jgi:hypothetical protein